MIDDSLETRAELRMHGSQIEQRAARPASAANTATSGGGRVCCAHRITIALVVRANRPVRRTKENFPGDGLCMRVQGKRAGIVGFLRVVDGERWWDARLSIGRRGNMGLARAQVLCGNQGAVCNRQVEQAVDDVRRRHLWQTEMHGARRIMDLRLQRKPGVIGLPVVVQ